MYSHDFYSVAYCSICMVSVSLVYTAYLLISQDTYVYDA